MNLTLKLNARFQPMHRFELEDALQEILVQKNWGEIIGGGTMQNPDGEIAYCDIEICLFGNDIKRLEWLTNVLNRIGIPKGSVLYDDNNQIEVGTLEGLACYLNGTELPVETYQTCDINYAIEQMELALEGIGRMYSYWESNTYTALYFYGTSFSAMKEKIKQFTEEYPLCQKCRIEQIA